jgi:hypothetical protein
MVNRVSLTKLLLFMLIGNPKWKIVKLLFIERFEPYETIPRIVLNNDGRQCNGRLKM